MSICSFPTRLLCERTDHVARKIEKILAHTPGVQSTTSVVGFSLLSFMRTSYNAFLFVTLEAVGRPQDTARAVSGHQSALESANSARFRKELLSTFRRLPFPASALRADSLSFLRIAPARMSNSWPTNLNTFMAAARKRPEIASLSTTFLPSVPQQFIDVDRDKVIKQGVAITDVYRTIQAFMGGLFINYFNRFGRQWQVYIEAEGEYRTNAENVGQFYVKESRWNHGAALGAHQI